ncbi:2-oxo acid dehydrogenase subunit E2 [Desulfovibrio inopinatus]|uniref:2-oxo acid dehydrogenase subunit E2 n=1 Tax=Desulfovibrio inopinatus TaxID=102109 RepID=UPI00040BA12E|nr:2-oxo acid dehydrogenase subunit E2 [Desulfovibrio inopinatus]
MAVEIVIPMLGVTVEHGTVVQWLKQEGDSIEKGEILFVVETEKVTTEVESPASGILGPILIPEGKEVPILTVVSHVLEAGESSPATPVASAQETTPAPVSETPSTTQEQVVPAQGVTEVVLPMLGVTVEKGMITQWLHHEGDTVQQGEPLFIVETEKVTTEVEAPASGVLAKILYGEGVEADLLTVVAYIAEPGTDFSGLGDITPSSATQGDENVTAPCTVQHSTPNVSDSGIVRAVPAARQLAKDKCIALETVSPTGPTGEILYKDVQAAIAQQPKASSLAKVEAAAQNVNLAEVQGTGVRGRIMRADVQNAVQAETSHAQTAVPTASNGSNVVPMNTMRKVIARRMCESKFGAPHIYFFMDICLDSLLTFRKQVLAQFELDTGVRISINDFLLKAVALCLREFPEINASYEGGGAGEAIRYNERINVGMAVALPGGLIVPALADVDTAGLAEVAQQRSDLVARARDGKLTIDEMTRGTFTVSSLAQTGVRQFTAILNPPQSGILSVPATREELYLEDGQVKQHKVTTLGLSVDHRIVDGSMAADFLKSLKIKLENPAFTFLKI